MRMRGRLNVFPLWFIAASAMLLVVQVASATAAVPQRGFEADTMRGLLAVVVDPSASDGSAAVLPSAHAAARTVDLVASHELEVTIASGCDRQARIRIRIDGATSMIVPTGSHTWHTIALRLRLNAGRHLVRLQAEIAARRRTECVYPRVDRIDASPATASGYVLLGAAMRSSELQSDTRYRDSFTANFQSLTPENELKMDSVEPEAGHYAFGPADTLVRYAVAHGKALRGHTLIYGSQLPGWVTSPSHKWTATSLLAVMRHYIATVMQRYAGEIDTWDVVNEALNNDGTYSANVWYDVIGPRYIEDAFRFARAADPGARLFYNDFGGERDTPKARAILRMIRELKARGVPIDGVGLQTHTDLLGAPTEQELEKMMTLYAQLGLRIEITEMDVGVLAASGTAKQKLQAQAATYRAAATACWEIAACHRLTTWGVFDGLSWIGAAQAPLLLDAAYRPKPAFFAVQSALHLR